MKKLLGLLVGALTSGCVNNEQLCIDKFFEIANEENIIHINDCSNKSGKFARYLRERKYKAEVIVLKHKNWKYHHAIVRIDRGQDYYYMDVANRVWGENLEEMYPNAEIFRVIPDFELYLDIEFREIVRFKSSF